MTISRLDINAIKVSCRKCGMLFVLQFSDILVYASRTATPSLQFKIHGQLPLRGMIVEQTDAVTNSFTIYGGNKCLPLAAG